MKRFLLFVVASLLFVACDNKFEDEGNTIQGVSNLPTLTAEFADEDTRTYVKDNFYLRWHEGDLISAFLGNTLNNKYMFNGATGDNSGTFSAVSSAELGSNYGLSHIYALYPYDKSAEISADGVISCTLPAEQEYAEESFGKGANTMVAVTKSTDDTFLAFKNACGYLKIKLYGNATVKSIELKGNNGEKIAGEASITATYGGVLTVAMTEDATDSITIDCGEGVKLSADAEKPTEFWFVVPPTEFSKGVTIIATDTYGTTIEKSTSNDITVKRNEIQPMATVEVIFRDPMKLANNEIWYTSINQIILPEDKFQKWIDDGSIYFGANIVSKIYNDGKGIITFDGDVIRIPGFWFYIGDISNIHYLWGNLTSITIPNSVTSIGYWAFYECKSLTSITMPNSVETIEGYAFCNCSSLTSITIPDSVTTIGDSAFSGCDSLTSVTIPDSVTTIGDYAFYGCTSLTSVTIPDSVTTIGERAFTGCDSLKEFKGKFAADNGRCLIVDGVLNSFAIACGATDYTIPDSVTTIGDQAFYSCTSLTSVTIPDSVTTIGERAFYGCTGELVVNCNIPSASEYSYGAFYGSKFTSVTIGDSVTTIGDYAFDDCDSLTSVTIGDSVTTIGNYAFRNCSRLTSVTIPDSVTTIGDVAFGGCDRLTSVTIPDSVTTIGGHAFSSCFSLTSITIPDSVTTIGEWAFYYCESLTSVTIPDSVTTIGEDAFAHCTSLTTVTIGDSVTTIGYAAFYDCDSLTSITIGDSVTTIGDYAFEDCTSLTSVTIPDSVTTIGYGAFRSCYSLTSITIGDSVTTIGDYAFEDCTSLTSVTIPDSVTTIGYGAFRSCYSLTSVYCKATTPPSSDGNAFRYNHSSRKIYVPRGCGEAYKSALYWSDYAADIVEYDF